MTASPHQPQVLHSTLADDPDLTEIVEQFALEMPDRVARLLGRLDEADWEGLRRAAHQLKGAAGSYGFSPITPAAAEVDEAIRQGRPEEEIRQAVDALIRLCRRVRPGSADSSGGGDEPGASATSQNPV